MLAGESSGDLLGSRVMRALREALPELDLVFEGIGGDAMQAEGFHTLYPMERLSVMGLVEPLGRLPELIGIRRDLHRRWAAEPPALFLGIDAPDFNLGLARKLRRNAIHTVQLVSPTVWAWRPGRIHKVAHAVNQLLCLFPFEPALYSSVDVDACYVGHPLVSELRSVEGSDTDRQAARKSLGIETRAQVIALLPGSRGSEVEQLTRLMVDAGQLLRSRDPRRHLLMPAANAERLAQCRALLDSMGVDAEIQLVEKQSREAMTAADVVLLASGTATLEAMLLQRPMAIAYRVAPLSWTLMSRLAVTPFVGLPNILAGEAIVPELLQERLTAPALAMEAESLLQEGQRQVDALAVCRASLERDFDKAVTEAIGPVLVHAGA
ncbi:MAG: lipid-A-disaccharide synthase [Congregibacter sp.]